MVKLVGLLDYDATLQKKYITPNYDLGVTYGVLKQKVSQMIIATGLFKELLIFIHLQHYHLA